MSVAVKELIIEDTDLPLLAPTIVNQQFIEKSGNQIPFSKLIQLNVALDALQPTPPNTTTVWFDNSILLQDASMASASLNVNPTNFTFSDGTTYRIGDVNALSTLDLFSNSAVSGSAYATLGSDSLNFNANDLFQFSSPSGILTADIGNINLNTLNGMTTIGDVNDNGGLTKLVVANQTGIINVVAPTQILLATSSCYIDMKSNNNSIMINGGVRYRVGYTTTTMPVGTLFQYGNMTYNGTSLNQSLGTVVAITVGYQILITNVNASTLTLSAGGGQLIYSTIGGGTSTKSLNTGHSHIFTAIQVGATTYGWSMV